MKDVYDKRITFTLLIFLRANSAFAAPIATDPDLPQPKTIGTPNIFVYQEAGQTGTVVLSDGSVISTTPGGALLTNPLAVALNLARPGDVIACKGELNGVEIGKYNPSKSPAVYWANGEVLRDISIVSEDSNQPCIIRGVSIMGNYLVPGGSGVDDLTFKDILFKNMGGSATAFIVFGGSIQGMIRMYNTGFVSGSPGFYSGYGLKWNIRANGRARYDIRGMTLIAAQEHGLYLDSPGADDMGDSYFLDITQTAPTGRTGIQIVNRKDPAFAGGISGRGDLYFRRLKLWTEEGGGGSGLTVAGHLGRVLVDELTYQGNMGAVVFWSDAGKGLHLTPDGFTCPYASLENIKVLSPIADRSHIAIKGVGYIKIRRFLIKGNKAAFDLDSKYGGPVLNGVVDFDHFGSLSSSSGFKAASKIKVKDVALSNATIDNLWP